MNRLLCPVTIVLVLATPALAAAETQTYRYDVHGRLVAVTRATTAATRTTTYGLDDANNRTVRTTATGSLAAGELASALADMAQEVESPSPCDPASSRAEAGAGVERDER